MSEKINYTRGELGAIKSQIDSFQVALGQLSTAIGQAESLLNAREALGEEPIRENIEAKFDVLSASVASVNARDLTIPSKLDFMDGFDAAGSQP